LAVDVGVDGGREGLKSFDPSTLPANPSPDLFYRHHVSLLSAIGKVRARREVIFALAERNVRARYKPPALGMAWALLSPVPQVVPFIQNFLPGDGVPRRPSPLRHLRLRRHSVLDLLQSRGIRHRQRAEHDAARPATGLDAPRYRGVRAVIFFVIGNISVKRLEVGFADIS
jgi:hypothetical protein